MNGKFAQKEMRRAEIRRFFSYFGVGGVSAVVEWALFALFANLIGLNYIYATSLAFVFSTLTNLILGKIWTFKESRAYEKRLLSEAMLVFLASGAGLLLNLGLMRVFVGFMGMNTPGLRVLGKIIATGMVFVWNYLIRRYVIYRK